MSKSNVKIVREYIEEVVNRKNFDDIFEFVDKKCIAHMPPFVGLGIMSDDSSGHNVIITHVVPDGPAHGHLQVGDELIRVQTDLHNWESFDDLRNGFWGHGVPGTQVMVTVRRAGRVNTIPLTSARMEGSVIKTVEYIDVWRANVAKNWRDLKMEIRLIFGEGDQVVCYGINEGFNLEYNRAATWDEMGIYRLKDGKIVEMWGVENSYEQLRQLGYQITAPVKELIP